MIGLELPTTVSSRGALVERTAALAARDHGAFDRLARLAARLAGATGGFIALVGEADAADGAERWIGVWAMPEPFAAARGPGPGGGRTRCRQVVETGEPACVDDLAADGDPGAPDDAWLRHVRAAVLVPLRLSDGVVLGVVGVVDRAARAWPSGVVQDLSCVAECVVTELERRDEMERQADAAAALRRREAAFEALAEHAPDIIARVDRRLRHVYVNEAVQRVTGIPAAEWIGRTPTETPLPREVAERTEAELRRVLQTGQPAEFVQFAQLAGAGRWFETRLVPEFSSAVADGPTSVLLVARDITDRRAAERALRTSEARFRAVVEATSAGVWGITAAGEPFPSGEAWWAELTGQARDAARAWGWLDAVHPDDRAGARAVWEHAFATQTLLESEYRVRDVAGVYRHIAVRGVPVQTESGLDWIGTFADTTEQRRAEAALQESERRLQHVMSQLPAVLWVTDRDLRVTLGHGTGGIDFNIPWSAVIGQTLPEFFGTDDPMHPLVAAARRALAGESLPCTVTFRGRTFDTAVEPLRGATGEIEGMIGVALDVTERLQAEAALRGSERRLRMALDAAKMVVWERDVRTGQLFDGAPPSPGVRAVSGGALGTYERFLETVHPDDRARVAAENERAVREGTDLVVEFRYVLPDGTVRWNHAIGTVIDDGSGEQTRLVGINLDITDRKQLEIELQQALKMDAIGKLAGGVAHDFNNLLTVIMSNVEFARNALPGSHVAQDDLAEVATAAERARTLVRQLLAFSRKQPLQPRLVNLNAIVAGAEQLLRRVIGEEIVLSTALDAALPVVRADPGQLEQVLLNLAVNARDAMLTPLHGHAARGGTLTIETSLTTVHGAAAQRWGVRPGAYVQLVVRDTGHGMDDLTRSHAFEPFFTTKAIGHGTGLGLATVYGVVAQSGGGIRVDTAPGAGSTFTILLPAATDDAERTAHAEQPAFPRGRGTLLLVEDESAVRTAARRILERQGYRVLEARHGADALALWREHADAIDAVVSDLRMPEMGGVELAAILRQDRPALPVIFVSGYSDGGAPTEGAGAVVLEKPFASETLLHAVQGALGEG